jgi:hypothetical protein
VVARGSQPELHRCHSRKLREGEQEAPVDLAGVDGKQVDLLVGVRPAQETIGSTAACKQVRDHDVATACQSTPLALHPPQLAADGEGEVEATMFGDRSQNGDAQLDGSENDRLLGDGSFDVRALHTNRCSHAWRTEACVSRAG